MTEPIIENVFDMLDEWRRLPSYQLERRADIYFAMFLTDVLEEYVPNTRFERLVIPEFPIRKGTLGIHKGPKDLNRSVKVDYVAFAKEYKRVFFVELKTSMKSRNSNQDSYLKKAAGFEFKELVEGVHTLRKHSDAGKKYDCLLEMLLGGPKNAAETKPKIVYVQPKCEGKNYQDNAVYITLKDFANVVKGRGSIGDRFAQSLERWAEDKM